MYMIEVYEVFTDEESRMEFQGYLDFDGNVRPEVPRECSDHFYYRSEDDAEVISEAEAIRDRMKPWVNSAYVYRVIKLGGRRDKNNDK